MRKFIEIASHQLGWKGIKWEGKGINEVGRRVDNNQIVIRVDEKYFRPSEVSSLLGDASKAREKLNWSPKISLEDLIKDMISSDKKLIEKEVLLKRAINQEK